MIALTVRLRVREGHLEPFRAAILRNAEASHRDEPGCRQFDVSQSRQDPHDFLFYELYDDDDAFEAHRAAPHFAEWRAAAEEHVEPGSQVNTFTTILASHREAS